MSKTDRLSDLILAQNGPTTSVSGSPIDVLNNTEKLALTNIEINQIVRITGESNRLEKYLGPATGETTGPASEDNWVVLNPIINAANNEDKYILKHLAVGEFVRIVNESNRIEQYLGPDETLSGFIILPTGPNTIPYGIAGTYLDANNQINGVPSYFIASENNNPQLIAKRTVSNYWSLRDVYGNIQHYYSNDNVSRPWEVTTWLYDTYAEFSVDFTNSTPDNLDGKYFSATIPGENTIRFWFQKNITPTAAPPGVTNVVTYLTNQIPIQIRYNFGLRVSDQINSYAIVASSYDNTSTLIYRRDYSGPITLDVGTITSFTPQIVIQGQLGLVVSGLNLVAVTKAELSAGVTVKNAGSTGDNGIYIGNGFSGPYIKYTKIFAGGRFISNLGGIDDGWHLTIDGNNAKDYSDYVSTSFAKFPWQQTNITKNLGDNPVPTYTRNDIAAPLNWKIVNQ